jgi:hypothetical protein
MVAAVSAIMVNWVLRVIRLNVIESPTAKNTLSAGALELAGLVASKLTYTFPGPVFFI